MLSSSIGRGREQLLLLHLLPLVILQTHDWFCSSQTPVAEHITAKHVIFCIRSVIASYWALARAVSDRGTKVWVVKIYQGWSSLFPMKWRAEKWGQNGQVTTKRQNERENDCWVRNACLNHHGLGAGKPADEAEPIPVFLEGLTNAIPSWAWHNTWYCFALLEALFANSTGSTQSSSVIVYFAMERLPWRWILAVLLPHPKKERGKELNQPLCPERSHSNSKGIVVEQCLH